MSAPYTTDYLLCELCDVMAPIAYCEDCDTSNHCGYCGVYEYECEVVLEVI